MPVQLLNNKLLLLRRIVMFALAGLLIVYHTTTLYNFYANAGISGHSAFVNLQSLLRIVIIMSLSLVILGVRSALWGMWIGISALIFTQFWAHFGLQSVDFTEGRSGFSYLRGFIFPTILTLIFPTRPERQIQ
jgi:hypothetical protein